jgi:hypothetical protein
VKGYDSYISNQIPQSNDRCKKASPLENIPLISALSPTPATTMSTGIVAVPLKPFTGDTSEAIAFWSALENHFYLNGDPTMTESRKVASALMHFQINTYAGDWAHEKMAAGLALTPINFRTWNGFKDAFQATFFPVEAHIEAANAMFTTKMGDRPFLEWYQEWSSYASQADANEITKIHAFKSVIPGALHDKLIAITPQPTTLDGLVNAARELDQIMRLYQPAVKPSYATSSHASTSRPPLTEEERAYHALNNQCYYCGKPGHRAANCRFKQQAQGGLNIRTAVAGPPCQAPTRYVCGGRPPARNNHRQRPPISGGVRLGPPRPVSADPSL